MKIEVKPVIRVVVVFLVMGLWLGACHVIDRADATPTSVATVDVDHCHVPWAIANGGYDVKKWCAKHGNNKGMDPLLKFTYKCGGGAVIAMWFVRKGRLAGSLGALSACAWGSLFEGHPNIKKQALHKALAVRSRGCPPGGMRAV